MKIAQLGCWAPPTVTDMIKILINRKLVYREDSLNKKIYKLNLTETGEESIQVNKQSKSSRFALLQLAELMNREELDYLLECFELLTKRSNNEFIFEYIEKVNDMSLKIDYDDFKPGEAAILKTLIGFENMLRTFVLKVENNHSHLLSSLGLTYPQIRALWILEAFQGITSNELSKLGYWSPSTANLVVKHLYTKNLIYKEKGKVKNSLYLYVSDEGHNLLGKDLIINQANLDIHNIVDTIGRDDLARLNNILYKMNNSLGNDMLDIYIKKTFKIREERINL